MALSRVFMFLKNCIRCKFEEGYSLPENTNTCKWYCDKINISPLKKIYLGCLLCANQSWRWQLNLLDLVFSGLSLTSFLKIHQIIIWPFEHPRIMGMFSIIPMFQQFDFKEQFHEHFTIRFYSSEWNKINNYYQSLKRKGLIQCY